MMKKKQKQIYSVIILIIAICVGVYSYFENLNYPSDIGRVAVSFIDVGQGDSEFIELPDNKCMLIDAGEKESSEVVIKKIMSLGYQKIDYLVATHPHIDHIGGMEDIINTFEIGEIYMPKAVANTNTYKSLLNTISKKGMTINTAKSGVEIYSDKDISIKCLAPVSSEYDDLNNYSAVIKLEFGKTSFLFMGDAEQASEQEMLDIYSQSQLKSDVLKVGHHGSKYSSSFRFLEAVNPEYAVIEVGEDNSYHHPHIDALRRINSTGAQVLRTDECSDITIVSDGNTLTVS